MSNRTCKIALLADVHLMRSQYGNPKRGAQICKSLRNAIEVAYEAGAEVILCAGDFLDSNTPGATVAAGYVPDIYEDLCNMKMTMYCIKGNHDDVEPCWFDIIGSVLENVLPAFDNHGIKLLSDGRKIYLPNGISIKGFDFGYRGRIKDNLENFKDADIIMLHGEVKEWVGYPSDTAVSLDDFDVQSENKPQLFLIGDTHVKRKDERNGTSFVSPGSVDYCSKSEINEPKTLTIAEFDEVGGKYKLSALTEVEYDNTMVAEYTLNTADDVNNMFASLQEHKPLIKSNGMLLYVSYNTDDQHTSLPTIQARLKELGISEYTTLMAQAMPKDGASTIEEKIANARTIKEQPDNFFRQKQDLFFQGERSPEFIELCGKLLNSKDDSKKALDDYISSKLDTFIIS